MFLTILHATIFPGSLVETQVAGLHPFLEFVSVILGWGLRICISDKFSADADVASWGGGGGIYLENY